jgi:hypothetical protein
MLFPTFRLDIFPLNTIMGHPGVGTAISEIFAKFGITHSASCSCDKKAKEWDALGTEWCEQHLDEMTDYLMSNMGNHPSFLAKFSSFLTKSTFVAEVFYRTILRNIIRRAILHVKEVNQNCTNSHWKKPKSKDR